ncbi:MAG: DUF445 family protein [Candidatus Sumerlaeia bacterium]|nr:DUF445 family protein [Candidatus Sumerlaeia bacterium]
MTGMTSGGRATAGTDASSRAGLLWLLRACGALSVVGLFAVLALAAWRLLGGPSQSAWPTGTRAALVVLASGSVGFLTNWLAIRMLFRPRVRRSWLVAWPQGLVPREQARFARALGQVAAERLMHPDAVAVALEDPDLQAAIGRVVRRELDGLLDDAQVRAVLVAAVTEGIEQHGPAFVQRLRPDLRQAAARALDQYLTSERVLGWIDGALRAFVHHHAVRRAVAEWVFRESARDGTVTRIMALLEEHFRRYRERHPVRGFFAEQFVLDWDALRDSLVETLRSESAAENLADVLIETAEGLAERLRAPEASEAVGRVRLAAIERGLDWCEERGLALLAEGLAEIGRKPETWEAVEGALHEVLRRLPEALFDGESGSLKQAFRQNLSDLQRDLLGLLPVAAIVEREVLAMDPATIERLVDEVGRRELAWIQILGFVAGLAMGLGLLALL